MVSPRRKAIILLGEVICMSSGWDEVDSDVGGSGGGRNIFYTPKEGKNTIRLIKQPHRFLAHWVDGHKEICLKESKNDDTYCPLCEKLDRPPAVRYIIMILDRDDSDENGVAKVKVYEGGGSVFSTFKMYLDDMGVDPGSSQEGPDWLLKKTIKEPGNPLSTTYVVMPMKATPFTNAEKKVIKEKLDEVDLTSFYKKKSVEDLRALVGEMVDEDDIDLGMGLDTGLDLDESDVPEGLEDLDDITNITEDSSEDKDDDDFAF